MTMETNGTKEDQVIFTDYEFYTTTLISCAVIFAIFGSMCNGGTILMIAIKVRPVSVQLILVLNMLVTNFILCAVCFPVYAFVLSGKGNSHKMEIACILEAFLRFSATSNYLMALTLVSLHRYFMVVHPQSNWLTFGSSKRAVIIMTLTIIFVLVIQGQAALGFWGRFGFSVTSGVCTLLSGKEGGSRSFVLLGYIIVTVMPLLVILFCYSSILCVIRKTRRVLSSQEKSAGKKPESSRRQKQETLLTRTMMIISGLYLICNVPLGLGTMFQTLDTNVYFKAVAKSIYLVHLVTDPLIYVFGDGNVRRRVTEMLPCRREEGGEETTLHNASARSRLNKSSTKVTNL